MPNVASNGITLHFEERGSGDPLILLMGLGAAGCVWEKHTAGYERHFRCLLIDNRGAGDSDKPPGPYTTQMIAEDTAGLMQALGIANARVAGLSMGSAIALQLLPVRIINFMGLQRIDWGPTMPFSVLVALPAIILFAIVQRNMISGLMSGFSK
jgi:alpha/beta hydrolase fold